MDVAQRVLSCFALPAQAHPGAEGGAFPPGEGRFEQSHDRALTAWREPGQHSFGRPFAPGSAVRARPRHGVVLTDPEFGGAPAAAFEHRSEEHTSELQSLMRTSYAVFCLKKKINKENNK